MAARLVALATGIGFGFVLAWARLSDPAVIRRMLLLREPDVFLLMGSAIVVAAVGVRVVRRWPGRAAISGERIQWTPIKVDRRHIAGSLLFGAGWSVAGTCPGPIAAMVGQGRFAGLIVAAGLMAGIWLKQFVDLRGSQRSGARAPSAETACL